MPKLNIGKKVSNIGSGQSSKVELYYNATSRKFYTVKVMNREINQTFNDYKDKCLKEYQISQHLHSRSKSSPTSAEFLAEILDCKIGILSRKASLIMEYYPITLSDYLKTSPSTMAKSVLFKQLAFGVNHLHSSGVSHRDLKIDNVCLDVHGTIKIIDFGTCVVNDSEQPSTGIYGTDPFISPEANGSLTYYGTKNDLWSLGIILYILLNNESRNTIVTHSSSSLSANDQITRELNIKGSNVYNQAIIYPWDSTSPRDLKFLAYQLHELQVEHEQKRHETTTSPLLEEIDSILNDNQPLPQEIRDYRSITEDDCTYKLLNLKNREKLTPCPIEIGIYRLWRNLTERRSWKTLSRLLKIDSALRGTIVDVVNDDWILEIDDALDIKHGKKYDKMVLQKLTKYSTRK
ncbi:hypothetical protein DASC09_031100 [Saccharomycopsis crataegensis]|uniref:Protein kinase domain-containing protein n=1 Tax=Saccharomycopsis crataegensis TaxID=43959 RepID=A0AAV5QLE7_9ASCO|nr:hypothetical protein DASC09_031100 [Saccharomycopsis crataegensis]